MLSRRDCHLFDLWEEGQVDPQEWADHCTGCPACRAQAALDRELRRRLGASSRPHLSPGFNRRLLARVEHTRHSAHHNRLRFARGWMVGYWLAAGLLSFVLLARIDGASATWSGLTLLAVATFAAGLVRSFGIDLVELIWWPTETPARNEGLARKPLPHGVR